MKEFSLWKRLGLISVLLGSLPVWAEVMDIPINYSYCGYLASEDTIPTALVVVNVPVSGNDQTAEIQQALDKVAQMPLKEGLRGAVQLHAGTYTLSGRLRISASGVVLRGAGADKTRLLMQGVNRQPAICMEGKADLLAKDTVWIKTPGKWKFAPGVEIDIVHPSTKEWIAQHGCDIYGGGINTLGWKPGDVDITYRRTVLLGEMLNVPIPMDWGNDKVYARVVKQNNRISQCGVEDLTIVAEVKRNDNPKDEQHLWTGISLDHAEDCWVRCVNFENLAGSGVIVQPEGQRITIEDCLYRHPVSEEANHRRNAFYVLGQQVLVQRCVADRAMHAFATGWGAAGPNAFVQCEAREALSYSGAIEAWSTGVLMDIVDIDGHDLMMANIGQDNNGTGWTSANGMCWQCTAAEIHCSNPDTLNQNRAYGCWSQFSGDGIWQSSNEHIKPRSLFYAQLGERLKFDAAKELGKILPRKLSASSSPSVDQAQKAAQEAREVPRLTLEKWILDIQQKRPEPSTIAIRTDCTINKKPVNLIRPASLFTISEGHLLMNGKLALGGKYNAPWWNGNLRPNYLEKKAQPALTRFVPDREGLGLTDRVDSVIAYMDRHGILSYDQCYGLWYDRRRDDHERIRRRDAECWAPFYEQPWDRTGDSTAWEGLSRYDLARPNLWYYARLQEYCQKAPHHLLYLHHYFQHNILEAGAHWVDCPWRPINNVNGTIFPEPVPFTGDKRIFMAEWFYDIQNETMRNLHRQYIRENLEQMRDYPNVVHLISNEYTGPLAFTRFWVECIAEWEAETGLHPLVALATTRDVQDSILADPQFNKVIDIIDIRYWFYREPDQRNPKDIWDPQGGLNMAPRQHGRKQPMGKTGFEEAYRSVYEYTTRYPEKVVSFYAQNFPDLGWAILMAGGSCCEVSIQDEQLLQSIASMRPVNGEKAKVLTTSKSALVYFTADGEVTLQNMKSGKRQLMRVNHDGTTSPVSQVKTASDKTLTITGHKDEIYWIK